VKLKVKWGRMRIFGDFGQLLKNPRSFFRERAGPPPAHVPRSFSEVGKRGQLKINSFLYDTFLD